ncbi:MAG: SCP2 sterol-binding domain-containing protein [Rhizobiaceae bacterium]
MSVQDIVAAMWPKVEAAGFDGSVKLDLGKDGVVLIDGATISTDDGPADCTVTLSLDDLEDMVSGELSPTSAFMTGKLKIDGDMSMAMALGEFL